MQKRKVEGGQEQTEAAHPEADIQPMALNKRLHVLLLEDDWDFQRQIMRAVRDAAEKVLGADKVEELTIAKNEGEVRLYQQIGKIDLFIWSGFGVPTRVHKPASHRELNLRSIDECLGVENSRSPGMRVIALVPDNADRDGSFLYFPREVSERLGIHQQVLGPEEVRKAGRFRDDIAKALQAELKQVKLRE